MKKTLFFLIESVSGGGAERVLIDIITHIDRTQFDLVLVVFKLQGRYLTDIPADVKQVDLSVQIEGKGVLRRTLALRRILREWNPDLVLSFMPGANCPLMRSAFLLRNPPAIILTEHNNPEANLLRRMGFIKRLVKKIEFSFFYNRADSVICVSEGVKECFANRYRVNTNILKVIHNPIDFRKIEDKCWKPVSTININLPNRIISVGRLVEQKGYYDLLYAFSIIVKNCDSHLFIAGEGRLKADLQEYAEELGVSDRVHFLGFLPNPWAAIRQCNLYISASLWEGFHLTLVEAMACGTPVVATNCDYGPSEIVTNGVNGFLVPVHNSAALAESAIAILSDSEISNQFSEQGRKVAETFDVTKKIKDYQSAIYTVLSNKNKTGIR